MLIVADPVSPRDFDDIRALARAFRDFLATLPLPDDVVVTYAYQPEAYEEILSQIETLHAPPRGALKLARLNGAAVGCGMMQTISPGVAEIKRVFVADTARGTGAGRAVMQALIDEARGLGFHRICLDTARVLTSARHLYPAVGFRECAPYWPAPPNLAERLVFFEMDL